MLADWADSLIPVSAGLGGAVLAFWLQRWASREQREEAYRRTQESLGLDVVAALMTALDSHRSAMWMLMASHHAARDQARSDNLARTLQTRIAISGPLTRLHVIVPSLRGVADAAVNAVYAMHHSTDLEDLEVRRLAARDAADRFRAEAVQRFSAAGIGLVLPELPPEAQRESKSLPHG